VPAVGNTTRARYTPARLVGLALNVRAAGGFAGLELTERAFVTFRIVTVGFKPESGWLARPCWSTVMSTIHGSPAANPVGCELSLTVAQPPASAVLAHTSATAAARTIAFRTLDLLVRMLRVHRTPGAGSDRGDPAVQISPPLVATQVEFDEIVRILGDVLTEAAALMR
jgi:hypothetical protein